MKYTGIDLHSNNSVISVINETDKVVAEKRLPNDLARILEFLEPHKADMAGVVVESTYNWYWVVDGLQEAGYAVHLANTTAIKKYDGLKHSGDETDARHLAHLLRLGILPTGTIPPPGAYWIWVPTHIMPYRLISLFVLVRLVRPMKKANRMLVRYLCRLMQQMYSDQHR
jgi:hypothetical protein